MKASSHSGRVLTLLTTGVDVRRELSAAIASASDSLCCTMYIFGNDEAAQSLLSELIGAARKGVRVRMIIDAFGSMFTSDEFFDPLRQAGGQILRFNSDWHPRYLFRNHQKFLIIDSTVAFVGGFNIANEYFGDGLENGWREIGLRVQHPNVTQLQSYFDQFWETLGRQTVQLRDFYNISMPKGGSKNGLEWLTSGPSMRSSAFARYLKRDLAHASNLSIVMGYFVPSASMRRIMGRIARRGKVRIVLPWITDVPISRYAAWFTYKRLLHDGCEIYEYQPRPLHAKLLVVDDVVYVGSANVDFRSLHLNFEMIGRIHDADLAVEARQLVHDCASLSKRITQEFYEQNSGVFQRLIQRISYLVLSRFDFIFSRRFVD